MPPVPPLPAVPAMPPVPPNPTKPPLPALPPLLVDPAEPPTPPKPADPPAPAKPHKRGGGPPNGEVSTQPSSITLKSLPHKPLGLQQPGKLIPTGVASDGQLGSKRPG